LGVSTRHELEEALRYDFDGIDITGYVFGRNKDRKNSSLLKERVKELIIKVKQKRITDFTVFHIAEVRRGCKGRHNYKALLNARDDVFIYALAEYFIKTVYVQLC